ncbi:MULTISPECIES: thiol:disulfide interchange protein DsbA/DsbL [Pseudomonadota]|uniref:thiol:disulfide interchange protein DsbA/DsbL n=1 Tax=Pseudomonadota TaxID=1224 RepID=UPI0012A7E7AC|nr:MULTISPECIES: thiol:disulfide interchange protein DsbA/DsbL [Pseudomonadota]MBP8322106.1 thiol:disulfide interchange protein DsbA/DsbL [Pseudomonas aeruginosa]MCZ8438909.1 thiol:disulfide interchange protein DsbA/DsbL [Achromobacter xylosoxidans]MDC6162368.1 thiol:disulfide interchange protein DsbA/DsbL [Achromobacter xylosoxidans]CUR68079.1 Thiol:disulfide interchange protein DsbA precursor [Achromobacter xylosoxidans]
MSPYRFSLVLAVLVSMAPAAQARQTEASVAITPAQPADTVGRIEVLEFFSYSCGPCATMDPLIEKWASAAPADVTFKRVPVAFNASLKPQQQLYYTLSGLGRLDLHPKVFEAIHVKRERLRDRKAIVAWASEQGLDRSAFEAMFDSFGVQTQVQRADQLVKAYQMDGTPSFAVGGRYLTSPAMANGYEAALQEVDRLIPLVRN